MTPWGNSEIDLVITKFGWNKQQIFLLHWTFFRQAGKGGLEELLGSSLSQGFKLLETAQLWLGLIYRGSEQPLSAGRVGAVDNILSIYYYFPIITLHFYLGIPQF